MENQEGNFCTTGADFFGHAFRLQNESIFFCLGGIQHILSSSHLLEPADI
jgi:hypothetical protein